MKRLSDDEITKIIELTKNGSSLRKISTTLRKPKNVIYYHVKKRFGKKLRALKLNYAKSTELGEFLGIFASDGTFMKQRNYRYIMSIFLSPNQREYSKHISKIMSTILGKEPNTFYYRKGRVYKISVMGKDIENFLKNFLEWEDIRSNTIRFKPKILKSQKSFLKGIVRGLVAGDGSVYVPKNRISFGSVSKNLALQYVEMLSKFGVKSYIYPVKYPNKKTLYHVHVTRLDNVLRFRDSIGLTDKNKSKLLDKICSKAPVIQPG